MAVWRYATAKPSGSQAAAVQDGPGASAYLPLDKEPAPGLLGTVDWSPVEKPAESGRR